MGRGLSRRGVVPYLGCAVLAALILGPMLLRRGFALVGDMVFVPRQPWKDQWLGADGSVPRAVPSDAIISWASQLVAGDLLQKAVLLALLLLAGWGMVRLLAERGRSAGFAAATLYVWNPYVYERLAIGDWALLCGYAAAPWAVVGAKSLRAGRRRGWWVSTAAVAAAAFASPTGGLAVGTLAAALVAVSVGWRATARFIAIVFLVNVPWVLPGLLSTPRTSASGVAAGVTGFAAAPDTPLGTLGSLVTLGGSWKVAVAAPGRDLWLLALLALVISMAGLAGALLSRGDPHLRVIAVLGAVGLLLAWLPATRPGASALRLLIGHFAGAGVLRDSQKWLLPFVLLVCVGLGELVGRNRPMLARVGVVGTSLLLLLPVALLPGLAWGEFGRLTPVTYPSDWTTVAQLLDQSAGANDRTLVLPLDVYRRFAWNGERAFLDPAPRFFPGDVVVSDALPLSPTVVVPGEDPVVARLAQAMGGSVGSVRRALREERVNWVLIERGTPGTIPEPFRGRLGTVVYDGPDLRLLRVGPAATVGPYRHRTLVLASDGAAIALLAILGAVAPGRRRHGPTRGYTLTASSQSRREPS